MSKQNLLVAVSGGVDSVVLLDMLVKADDYIVTVAHFDHGIRPDSAADARFVAGLAKKYHLPFVSRREELGLGASEEQARKARYDFLFSEARKRGAVIATAHHMDDVVETIAINIVRGTGWRGAAVLNRAGVVRPLLGKTKEAIYEYALKHRLEWVEDSTNGSDVYLRNRLRKLITRHMLIATKLQLLELRNNQCEIKQLIDAESSRLLPPASPFSRYFFIQLDDLSAYELLRAAVFRCTQKSLQRQQLTRALIAIKTAQPGTRHDAGAGAKLVFTEQTFIVEKA